MSFKMSHRGGDFSKGLKWLKNNLDIMKRIDLNQYGQEGVEALMAATPVDTGKTANSWSYSISIGAYKSKIEWYNSNNNDGVNIAVIIQYGHALQNGGFVQGIDYVNPALKSVFTDIADRVWKEVVRI